MTTHDTEMPEEIFVKEFTNKDETVLEAMYIEGNEYVRYVRADKPAHAPSITDGEGDDVVERLKDAANRMLDGEAIKHNLSVFATDILTIINRASTAQERIAELERKIKELTCK